MSNQPQEIKIIDNIPGAEYANIMQVTHSKEEFQMMFGNIMGASGKVVSKIISSPSHFKRMLNAMQENIKKYEEANGEIKEADAPSSGIGFQV